MQNGHHGNGHPPSESARIKSYLAKLEREGIARVKMFIVITIAYLIFWGPLFLVTLFSYTDYKTEDPSTSHEVSVINFGFLKSSQLCQMKSMKNMVESFCCKKSPNQEIGLRRFSEYRTAEGSE